MKNVLAAIGLFAIGVLGCIASLAFILFMQGSQRGIWVNFRNHTEMPIQILAKERSRIEFEEHLVSPNSSKRALMFYRQRSDEKSVFEIIAVHKSYRAELLLSNQELITLEDSSISIEFNYGVMRLEPDWRRRDVAPKDREH